MNYEDIIDAVIVTEGGDKYTNDPADSGGPTRYGITEVVARHNGYEGDMKDLPEAFARMVYRKRYIVEPMFDKIADIDENVGRELIDTGVNMGPAIAAHMFQRWLNGFNDTGSHYANIFLDGRIGPVTVAAFAAYRRWRGAEGAAVMMYSLNCLQATRYLELAEQNAKNRKYLFGWVRTRVMAQLAALNKGTQP